MDRDFILGEIRRAFEANGGRPLSIARFEAMTGIPRTSWEGRHWTTWGAATSAAAAIPGKLTEAFSDDHLLARLAELVRQWGRFPSQAEIRISRVSDAGVPNDKVFQRFGSKDQRVEALRRFVGARPEFADVAALLPPGQDASDGESIADESADKLGDGFVYMVKLGRAYKVGRTFAVPRRHREITLELPQKPDMVHSIRTDDPDGIEAYWHRRFDAKRTNGEWFALNAEDVRAFKRRKFM